MSLIQSVGSITKASQHSNILCGSISTLEISSLPLASIQYNSSRSLTLSWRKWNTDFHTKPSSYLQLVGTEKEDRGKKNEKTVIFLNHFIPPQNKLFVLFITFVLKDLVNTTIKIFQKKRKQGFLGFFFFFLKNWEQVMRECGDQENSIWEV